MPAYLPGSVTLSFSTQIDPELKAEVRRVIGDGDALAAFILDCITRRLNEERVEAATAAPGELR